MPTDANSPAELPGLSGAWTTYRTWSATAKYNKAETDRWNRWALWFGISGAILATLGQQFAPLAPQTGALLYWFRAPGFLGSIVIAVAAYCSAQALAGNRDRVWIRTRAAAESIKSAIFLYRASVPPFDTPARTQELQKQIEKTLQDLTDVEKRLPPANDKKPALTALTVNDYIKARVTDQIDWYSDNATTFQTKADRFRNGALALGLLSAVLAVFSALSYVTAWAAVIATVITSITAHVKNQRYQVLIGLYQETATRLQILLDQWNDCGKTDADKVERDTFIERCEETLAKENGAWLAQWTQQPRQSLPVPQNPPPAGTEGQT